MKRILLLTTLMIFSINLFSQNPNKTYTLNFSIGAGTTYGGIGTKSVLGFNGSGFLIGIGYYGGHVGYDLGGQFRYKWWYVNLGYGSYGVLEKGDSAEKELVVGANLYSGALINISKNRRAFIDVGVGYSWGDSYTNYFGFNEELTSLSGVLGIGYRFK